MTLEQLTQLCEDIKNHHGLTIVESIEGYKEWFEDFKNGNQTYKPNLQGMTINNLSEEEAFYILHYTASASSWINSELRDGRELTCKCKLSFGNALNNSLEKVKSFNDKIVYRMDNPSSDSETILKWFNQKIGFSFSIPYFLSTAMEDYKNSYVVWKIKTLKNESYAKDISNITQNPVELEVLFKRNSKFIIKNVDFNSKYVTIEEINETSMTDFELTGLYHLNL